MIGKLLGGTQGQTATRLAPRFGQSIGSGIDVNGFFIVFRTQIGNWKLEGSRY